MQEELEPLEDQVFPIHNRSICFMCKKKMKMKRSRSLSPKASSSEEDMKRIKFEENEKANDIIIHPHILDFSDDVLLNIFKYLNPKNLMAISLSCQRLAQVAQDKTLWRRVDFRATPILLNDLKEYIKFLQPTTTSLAMRGDLYCENDAELSPYFLNSVKATCTQLKELIIEEYCINADKIQITDFPSTIEKLSLEGCKMEHLRSNKSYFFKMNFHMPNLTCLILSNCEWFTPHSLLVISKMPKLKELRLNSCHRLGECVAYTSLATRFGFKTLEILDLRDTALGDSEVGCFSCTKTLTHLYLECPSSLRNTESPDSESRPLQREPLNQHPVYEDRNLAQFLVEDGFRWENYMFGRCLITDRAICALGSDTCDRIINNLAEEVIVVEGDKRIFNNPHLKTLVVRNYPHVTNSSLVHLALNASSLEHLDVSGTSVTRQGVETFKTQRPNVKIVTSFDETHTSI
ncbi:F-box/LRR-repeat protein fbxl-1 isoform X1 [Bombus flavifrons]|uniref:F-box/LRR-repeat protein fbxl-1 isoform X1 n=2 Tax=Bombus flavifrons TaxID=103934 RepID=UPI003704233D